MSAVNYKPRILIVHGKYIQHGGEDQVVEAEMSMLREHGHIVELCETDNSSIALMSKVRLAAGTVWSTTSNNRIHNAIQIFQPNLIHVHNTFPLFSPSIYWTAAKSGIPIIQTLHNFRLICPQAMLLRDGKICEDCIGRTPWPGVLHSCYHNSQPQTAVIATMLMVHRVLHTYRDKIAAYIAPSIFSKNKLIDGGLPAEKIHIKPNFADIPNIAGLNRHNGLFVGRLSEEKGLACLAGAVHNLKNIKIDVIGAGPLGQMLESIHQFRLHGWKPSSEVYHSMREASYLIVPSICYETFGLIIIEAFACGLPVIASRIGALPEIVSDHETGLIFEPDSPQSLASAIIWAEEHPAELAVMGNRARDVYEKYYTPQSNYVKLLGVYQQVLDKNPVHSF